MKPTTNCILLTEQFRVLILGNLLVTFIVTGECFPLCFLTPSSKTYSESCVRFSPPLPMYVTSSSQSKGTRRLYLGSDCFSSDKLQTMFTISLVMLTSQFNSEIRYSENNKGYIRHYNLKQNYCVLSLPQ